MFGSPVGARTHKSQWGNIYSVIIFLYSAAMGVTTAGVGLLLLYTVYRVSIEDPWD